MKNVNTAVAGSAAEAAKLIREWSKKYAKVTRAKIKTSRDLMKESPGRYGPYYYVIKAWK
uniref:Uncharacterized protein n=1 Tax=viral metagenome TaxID=1070528 RepID=A0A6H2A5T9_9ZZZZ